MRSSRLRLICTSATVAAVFVAGAASNAAAVPSVEQEEGWSPFPPPSAYGCETQPGPVSQTIAYAHCQTVATIDAVRGTTCAVAGVGC